MEEFTKEKLLIIEPFYGGSHKKLIDIICSKLPDTSYKLITMKAKKWHWRARSSALYVSTQIPVRHTYEAMFCTSVLPLAELIGMRPDLATLHKVVYFHENQLQYPVQVTKERDFQYGFNEILTCLTADKVLFNSKYNMKSFLSHINGHLKIQPDYRVSNIEQEIAHKCDVVYFPLDLWLIDEYTLCCKKSSDNELHIVWPHRWEFDKNPQSFYEVLCKLDDSKHQFKVSIIGESYTEKPDVFNELSSRLQSKLLHFGYVEDPHEYYKILNNCDVVVSTAKHEFFGVSVLEAVYVGCIPVVPKRLSYRELFEDTVTEMYDDDEHLLRTLSELCVKKQDGKLQKNYKHIALKFEAEKWFQNFLAVSKIMKFSN